MARIELDEKRIKAILRGQTYKSSQKAARIARRRTRENINLSGRIDTGAMVKSVQVKAVGASRWQVYSNLFYTKFQEFGTRAHGPVHAKALRFIPKGGTTFVFAKRVRGVTGAHFFEKAMRSIRLDDWKT